MIDIPMFAFPRSGQRQDRPRSAPCACYLSRRSHSTLGVGTRRVLRPLEEYAKSSLFLESDVKFTKTTYLAKGDVNLRHSKSLVEIFHQRLSPMTA